MIHLAQSIADQIRSRIIYRTVLGKEQAPFAGARHCLPGELIVSLTSYEARFRTLEATIRCLLNQDVTPDFVILWISQRDRLFLPRGIERLRSSRFLIEETSDVRSYTKIIPCLVRAPASFILTCDDDVFYPRNWLGTVVSRYRAKGRVVCGNRAHKIRLDSDGIPLPYDQWDQEIRDSEVSTLVFPTGVGGVLYEPNVFYDDVTDRKLFSSLCPSADDVWLYWMACLAGNSFQTTSLMNRPLCWPSSQRIALRNTNTQAGGGNDVQVKRMIEAYGLPFSS